MRPNGFVIFILIVVIAAAGIYFWRGRGQSEHELAGSISLSAPAQQPSDAADGPTSTGSGSVDTAASEAVAVADDQAGNSAQSHTPSPAIEQASLVTAADRGEAEGYFRRGKDLLAKGDNIKARSLLSKAIASGALADSDEKRCKTLAEKLAEEMIFSSRAYTGDPLSRTYRIRSGDSFAVIVKREKLMIPHEALQIINNISNPRAIRVDQKIKLLNGPFNAIITKHSYTLDLYLQDVFVRSFHVGLGRDGSTPLGAWKVRDRMSKAPWTSPEGKVHYPGDADYPLGRAGYWIALQGLDASNETFGGFGIHGTNEPDSIGTQASHGCVRLIDEDIDLLYKLLYNGSRIEVRP